MLDDDDPTVFVIAAWALTNEGTVIGLIGQCPVGGPTDVTKRETPRLLPVPPVSGIYKHVSTLTAKERKW